MRVFASTLLIIFLVTTINGSAFEQAQDINQAPAHIHGVYCYDFFFIGNNSIDTTYFPGNNPNASFLDPEDIPYYKDHEDCSTFIVSNRADVNVMDPFFDRKKEVDYSTDSAKILPNPRVGFVEEGSLDFKRFKSQDTMLYGGVLPFVALPDGKLATEDSFINEDSVSFFFYFKQKF